MPIYEYHCQSCGSTFEKILRMADHAVPVSEPCPQCESTGTVQQNFTAPNICQPTTVGATRVPAGFGQVLDRISAANPHNRMHESKFARTREV